MSHEFSYQASGQLVHMLTGVREPLNELLDFLQRYLVLVLLSVKWEKVGVGLLILPSCYHHSWEGALVKIYTW